MAMASVTALKPPFAVPIVAMLSSRSSSRRFFAVSRFVVSVLISSFSRAISASRSLFLISRASRSRFRSCASFMRKSRSVFALASSVSQNPFLVASASDSASSLSINFWMSPLILVNGSAATFIASVDRMGLLKRCPSFFNTSTTRACLACVESPERVPRRRAFAWLMVATSCTNATLAECGAMLTLRAGASGTWSRARWFTASASFTFSVRTSRAPTSAASSSLRMLARWSQSLALASHCTVRSLRYNWSSFKTPSVVTSVPRSVAILPVSLSMSASNWSMAILFASI
mmetsp:Transcript_14166/g.37528  ORF Transcript_14166/g.37528 Transcript_14166/m.37528 type:complete len:289 (+) Transcript_14166:357-1223(+)